MLGGFSMAANFNAESKGKHQPLHTLSKGKRLTKAKSHLELLTGQVFS
jgi:hypothetical protein